MGKGVYDQGSGKKFEERKYLDQLIRLYPGFPHGRILPSESPDFLIHTGRKRRTGIELTRLTLPRGSLYAGEDHFRPGFSLESVYELIRNKEAKISRYLRRGLVSVWLVILVDGFSVPQAFNIDNQLKRLNPETRFNAVLILDLADQKVYEVKPPAS